MQGAPFFLDPYKCSFAYTSALRVSLNGDPLRIAISYRCDPHTFEPRNFMFWLGADGEA